MDGGEYFVRIDSLAGRQAGDAAARKAEEVSPAEAAAWLRGSVGERTIGRALNRLRDDGWCVVHDVPVGARGANIDHIVVGAPGVFTINTKNLSGNVWVASRTLLAGGRRTSNLPDAVREATRASWLLGHATGIRVSVTPILALLCAQLTIKEEPADVVVMRGEALVPWLSGLPGRLDRDTVRAVGAAAYRPETWTTRAPTRVR